MGGSERDRVIESHYLPKPTQQQVKTLDNMIAQDQEGEELKSKWMTAAGVDALDEMPADYVDKCIDYLSEKMSINNEDVDF